MTYALDTNIVSYLLKYGEERELVAKKFYFHLDQGDDIVIIPIVYYEITRGLMKINSVNKTDIFNDMFSKFGMTDFDFGIWNKSAEIYFKLREKGSMIDEMDILIAAFCIINDYVLVTHNTAHFNRIEELSCVDWVSKED